MAVSFDIAAWHVWLALGLLLIIAEVIGTELVLLALGAAALATGLAAATADLGLNMQLLVYGIAAALFVPVFMTFYRRRFKPPARARWSATASGATPSTPSWSTAAATASASTAISSRPQAPRATRCAPASWYGCWRCAALPPSSNESETHTWG